MSLNRGCLHLIIYEPSKKMLPMQSVGNISRPMLHNSSIRICNLFKTWVCKRAITLMISPMYGHVTWWFLASELIVQKLHASTVYLVYLDSNILTPLIMDQCGCSVAETLMSCGESSEWLMYHNIPQTAGGFLLR